MLNTIKNKLNEYAERAQREQQRLADRFDDPIASNTSWSPLKSGGSNFQTQALVTTPEDQLKVKATRGLILFLMIFIVIGAAAIIVAFIGFFEIFPIGIQNMPIGGFFGMIAFGLLFTLPAYFLLRPKNSLTFDKTQGFFWRGARSPREVVNTRDNADFTEIERIKGIQILSERVTSSSNDGRRRSYNSYELNLILDNGERVNVMDHGKLYAIREDARKLSEYLNVPVFDSSLTS